MCHLLVNQDYLLLNMILFIYVFLKRIRVERNLVHSCFQDNPNSKDHCNNAGLLFYDYVSHALLILRNGQHRLCWFYNFLFKMINNRFFYSPYFSWG